MACSVGIDFGAKLMASLAKTFEDEYHKEDNISLRNITLLLSNLCIFGVCSSELIYDFLIVLSKRLTEVDVSTILTVLQSCGMKIRADDPLAMKNYIQSVQNRVNELKPPVEITRIMLTAKEWNTCLKSYVTSRNNQKRAKEDTAHHTRIKNWLQKVFSSFTFSLLLLLYFILGFLRERESGDVMLKIQLFCTHWLMRLLWLIKCLVEGGSKCSSFVESTTSGL